MMVFVKRIRFLSQTLIILMLCSFPSFGLEQPPNSGETFVTVERLRAVLQSKNLDLLEKTLNDVNRMGNKSMILPLIRDLWELRKENHPDIPWDVAENDSIRLRFADVLLQARDNGYIKFDPSDMVKFAVDRLKAPNFRVRIAAIFVLGQSETDQAVEFLFKEARRQHSDTYRAAVLALIEMCNSSSDRAIGNLKGLVKDRIRQKFLYESEDRWREFNRGHPMCHSSN